MDVDVKGSVLRTVLETWRGIHPVESPCNYVSSDVQPHCGINRVGETNKALDMNKTHKRQGRMETNENNGRNPSSTSPSVPLLLKPPYQRREMAFGNFHCSQGQMQSAGAEIP